MVDQQAAKSVDIQVNGYRGVDFNSDDLTAESLHKVCGQLESDGVDGILATIITDSIENMSARLARLATLRDADPLAQKRIWGFHIEGPFINKQPGYVGAHPAVEVLPATIDAMQRLLEAAGGLTKIVTLAPERDAGMAVTRMLADQGICVSGGHCNPTLDQLDAAIDAGLNTFTHLGNGCPKNLDRHDNIIQRVLSRSDQLWVCFIGDGVHVPWTALGNYLQVTGIERAIVTTDAISAAGLGPGEFQLGDQVVHVDENGATWSADRSHLMGSASTMPLVRSLLRKELRLSESDVTTLTSTNPRSLIASCG
ncbi:MAG: N-acetylglucosamine-6-phosphate deacetylase [Planctomycetes bacterium]|nr:N-acetylglucosamine-6-phosphate deacetylase [Planctomycetota bacterium]